MLSGILQHADCRRMEGNVEVLLNLTTTPIWTGCTKLPSKTEVSTYEAAPQNRSYRCTLLMIVETYQRICKQWERCIKVHSDIQCIDKQLWRINLAH